MFINSVVYCINNMSYASNTYWGNIGILGTHVRYRAIGFNQSHLAHRRVINKCVILYIELRVMLLSVPMASANISIICVFYLVVRG